MPLNDLTPQLRTRLSRVERAVGLFVTLATLVLLGGFGYYLWHTAERKGWFLTKLPYFTFVRTGAGLKVGDPVKLMGFTAGKITRIEAQPPDNYFNVIVQFEINEPYYGYLWTDSQVKVAATDFLGNRYLEVTKGGSSGRTTGVHATYREETVNGVKAITGIWDDKAGTYRPWKPGSPGYWLQTDETPALTERLDALVKQAEEALPGLLALTNRLQLALDQATELIAHLNRTVQAVQPAASNLALITTQLSEPRGALGDWLLPTNLAPKLALALDGATDTLGTARASLISAEHNLNTLSSNLTLTLINLANITSNLHTQVEANTNLVTSVNAAIIQADTFLQGLKRHWLLRSAFRTSETNLPPRRPLDPKPSRRVPPGK
jgi:ABC-type transporter Mla subunit MlaD